MQHRKSIRAIDTDDLIAGLYVARFVCGRSWNDFRNDVRRTTIVYVSFAERDDLESCVGWS